MRTLIPALLLLSACPTPSDDTPPAPACEWEGGNYAGVLDRDTPFAGPDALARKGDFILANGVAAFVIQAPNSPRTYYHYGGIPIDVVALNGCDAAGPEKFGELGFLPGRLNAAEFTSSTLRQFRGDSAEVIADGSDGGDTIVRVKGADDMFWLVDYTLTQQAWNSGKVRPLSGPLGVEITVDYVLHPGSPVLEMRFTVTNTTPNPNQLVLGAAAWPSDQTHALVHNDGNFGFGGFNLQTGVPWFAASSGDAAWAFTFETGSMARTNVSGVEAILDMTQFVGDPLVLGAADSVGESRSFRAFLSVGATDEASAIGPLLQAFPSFAGREATTRTLEGTVTASEDGRALANASIDLQVDRGTNDWSTFDRLRTDASGHFSGLIPVVPPDARPRRALVHVAGRPDPAPIALDDATSPLPPVVVDPAGGLTVHVRDDGGHDIAARISLYDADGHRKYVFFVPPEGGTFPVEPGDYVAAASHGYEFSTVQSALPVPSGDPQTWTVTLRKAMDTTGWLSYDGHVHAGPSPDSDLPLDTRFASVVADGLEVAVHTEHEIIVNDKEALEASRWAGLMVSVIGEEVTATTPEHLSLYGTTVNPEDGPRGNPVRWYEHSLGELYDLMRERGAQAVVLNHPKWGCSVLCQIGWDTVLGEPTLKDPTVLGLAADKSLWSWEFDGVELLNGTKYIFAIEGNRGSGLFDDWANWINLGHRITAVGSSDVHEVDTPGTPRTYITVPDENLSAWQDSYLGDAIKQGHAQISTGAFAHLSANGVGIGDTATATDGHVALSTRIEAMPEVEVDHVVVFYNCDAVLDIPATGSTLSVKLDEVLNVPTPIDGSIVVMAFGDLAYPQGLEAVPADVPRVITNPIYVDADGDGTWTPPGGKLCHYASAVPAPVSGR